ncbi:Phospholipid scramblase family member 5 [Sciurus carolinensis]|uniref:Phospholipid scramblase n=1 Tax=Sciurus carolinensis TaxID=30640 RepID=A0AA41T2T3_SCICA|nr:Phospholipid scramblase family member 5 [Sciurus carolinensis]
MIFPLVLAPATTPKERCSHKPEGDRRACTGAIDKTLGPESSLLTASSYKNKKVILGTETSNKYEIKNGLGQRIYFAVEESICFNRTFCSTLRSCTLRITDNSGREVITVNRPLRCNSCWCPCYLQELEIQVPPGTVVGYVAQKWDPFQPKFTIQNANKEDILKIVGPCATCGCFGDVDFEVKTMNEKLTIGKISKYWSGFVNDVFTNADNFGIHVPADLDVTVKAAMIGACFLFVSVVLRVWVTFLLLTCQLPQS